MTMYLLDYSMGRRSAAKLCCAVGVNILGQHSRMPKACIMLTSVVSVVLVRNGMFCYYVLGFVMCGGVD